MAAHDRDDAVVVRLLSRLADADPAGVGGGALEEQRVCRSDAAVGGAGVELGHRARPGDAEPCRRRATGSPDLPVERVVPVADDEPKRFC